MVQEQLAKVHEQLAKVTQLVTSLSGTRPMTAAVTAKGAAPLRGIDTCAEVLPCINEATVARIKATVKNKLLQNPPLCLVKVDRKASKHDGSGPKTFFSSNVEDPIRFLTSVLVEMGINPTEFMRSNSPNTGRNVIR